MPASETRHRRYPARQYVRSLKRAQLQQACHRRASSASLVRESIADPKSLAHNFNQQARRGPLCSGTRGLWLNWHLAAASPPVGPYPSPHPPNPTPLGEVPLIKPVPDVPLATEPR